MLNPRRGDGQQLSSDFLYADLLIHDPTIIQDIRSKAKREVSAGYDAEYRETAPGEGYQHDIIGNHVALVMRGRCGPSCSIGDSKMPARTRRNSWYDRIMHAVRTKDEAAAVEELEKVQGMLGETTAIDAEPDGMHHVTVNIHNPGGAHGARTDDEPPPPGGGAPAPKPVAAPGGGENMPPWAQDLMQRVGRIEEAITILAEAEQADVGGEAPGGGDPGGDPDNGAAAAAPSSGENNGGAPPPKRSGEDAWRAHDDGEETEEERRRREEEERTHDAELSSTTGGEGGKWREGDQPGGPTERAMEPKTGGDARRPTGDRRTLTGDSARLRSVYQETVIRGEILGGGVVKFPTFDSASPAQMTADTLCQYRRSVLRAAWHDQSRHDAVAVMADTPAPDFGKMTCDSVTSLFNRASELVRARNNGTFRQAGTDRTANMIGTASTGVPGGAASLGEMAAHINAKNREFYTHNKVN